MKQVDVQHHFVRDLRLTQNDVGLLCALSCSGFAFPSSTDGEENRPYLPYNIVFKSIYHTPVDAQPAGC
jgi:hypothetical protein